MKLMIMPKQMSWWTWTITAILLAVGLAGYPEAFVVAILLSAAQTVVFLAKDRSPGRLRSPGLL